MILHAVVRVHGCCCCCCGGAVWNAATEIEEKSYRGNGAIPCPKLATSLCFQTQRPQTLCSSRALKIKGLTHRNCKAPGSLSVSEECSVQSLRNFRTSSPEALQNLALQAWVHWEHCQTWTQGTWQKPWISKIKDGCSKHCKNLGLSRTHAGNIAKTLDS